MVTRTYNRIHFDDLDAIRFEDLSLSIIYRMRRWERLDHLGRLGSDQGIDIRAYERLENGKINSHYFQCKRYSKINRAQIRNIVVDFCSKNSERPDYYYLIAGCDISKSLIDYFVQTCKENGFKTVIVWSASILEAMLFSDYHDLLFAFFGINLTENRNNRVNSIRRNVALKKSMRQDFLKSTIDLTSEERKEALYKPYLKFKNSNVLIRSIYDTRYPENTLLEETRTGYYRAEVYDFYHNGLMVRSHPFCLTARIVEKEYPDVIVGERTERLETLGCIPFENIITYDLEGDEFYNYPHLYCDFINGSDPYEKILYRCNDGRYLESKDILEFV